MADFRYGEDYVQDEDLFILQSKEVIKDYLTKRHRSQLEGAPIGQRHDNLHFNNGQNCNALIFIVCLNLLAHRIFFFKKPSTH